MRARRVEWSLVLHATLLAGCGDGSVTPAPGADSDATCPPGARMCADNDVYECNASGTGWEPVRSCGIWGPKCVDGECVQGSPPDTVVGLDTSRRGPDSDSGMPATTDTQPGADTADAASTLDSVPLMDVGPETAHEVVADAQPIEPADATPDAGTLADTPVAATPESFGPLEYKKVANTIFFDDMIDVSWRPDGSEALVISLDKRLIRYDAAQSALSEAADLDGDPTRVAWHPAGAFAFVVGKKGGAPALWRWDAESGTAEDTGLVATAGLRLTAVSFTPDGERAVAAGYSESPSINWFFVLDDPFDKVTKSNAVAGPGLTDAVWGGESPLLYDGTPFILLAEGFNGAGSHTWLPDSNQVVDNGWKASFGNPGRGAWRPNGDSAFIIGTSSNIIYLFSSGVWSGLQTQFTGSNLAGIAWNKTGTRALITGRAFGNPLKGTVVEYRVQEGTAETAGVFIEQSVSGFGAAPYIANGNTYVHQAAWRPAVACAEGLLVASDGGSSWSPSFGLVIRFRDATDPDCTEGW